MAQQKGNKATFFNHLSKGNFGDAFKSLSAPTLLNPGTYQRGNFWLFGGAGSGKDLYFSFNGNQDALKAYNCCAPVAAVINKKAQAYINGKTWVLNSSGKSKNKEATNEAAVKLKNLLAKPNAIQSWKQFEAQGYVYRQLMGYNVLLPIKAVGFDNIDAKSIWNIPPSMLEVVEKTSVSFSESNSPKDFIESIHLVLGTTRKLLDLDRIYIIKDTSPSFDSLILPQSRIRSLKDQINNIVGAYESRSTLIHRRGALGILSSEKMDGTSGSEALTKTEKEDLQDSFLKYGLTKDQWSVIISDAAVKWQQMGYPTKDLMLFEEIEDDIMRICDSFNFPYPLMSSNRTNNLGGSNTDPNKKLLYQDTIIPEAESDYEQWNNFFELSKYGIYLDKDYSHIPVLQEDKVNAANARKTLNEAKKIEWEFNLITLNQWLESLGEDAIGDAGNFRRSEIKDTNTPLAVTLGVGGTQSLITVLTANISEEAKRNTLEVLFGLDSSTASRMAASGNNNQNQSNNG